VATVVTRCDVAKVGRRLTWRRPGPYLEEHHRRDSLVGAVIGNYQLVRKLGEGGMGVVYLGQHTLLGRRAAIKVLLPALSARTDIVNRFFNEARAVTSISDPGIVQVFDFGYHSDGSAFIVMEFLEGEPLDRRLARLGRLPAYDALRLGRQVASSLAAAHAQHIVHRDLKPENIFLVRDGEVASGERSKILDFGIAKLSDEHPGKVKTHTGMLMGTPTYMSPEQCRGLAEIDHRSDIYALGCVLFHLLTGRPPFEGEGIGDIISAHIREPAPAPSSRAPGIPPNVDALVLRCLAKAPADRFQTMVELASALGSLLEQVPAGSLAPAAPAYHSVPTTKLPLDGATATPITFGSGAGPFAPVGPTTLGASSGQLVPTAPRTRRIGRWIAGGFVVGAAGVGIAILGMRSPEAVRVTSRSTGSTEPMVAPGSGSSMVSIVQDAGSAALVQPPDAAEPAAVNVADAGSDNPSNIASVRETTAEQPTPSGGKTVIAAPEPTKKLVRPRDRGPKTARSTTPVSPSGASRPATTDAPPPKNTPARALAGSAASPPPPPPNCGKAVFAAVYNAAVPPPGSVRTALRNLKACHDAGAISDAEFDQTQAALVARM
jgi:eukaryotic-like serine/threonine-protein kinase